MRVRIKICGVTRVEDALAAAHLGADAVGVVFAESPRRVTADQAAKIVRSLPSFVCPVGVFVDAPCEEVLETARAVGLHCVQLAGSETPGYLEGLAGLSVIKVIHVGTARDAAAAGDYQDAAILLDTASRGAAGGTGESFLGIRLRPGGGQAGHSGGGFETRERVGGGFESQALGGGRLFGGGSKPGRQGFGKDTGVRGGGAEYRSCGK